MWHLVVFSGSVAIPCHPGCYRNRIWSAFVVVRHGIDVVLVVLVPRWLLKTIRRLWFVGTILRIFVVFSGSWEGSGHPVRSRNTIWILNGVVGCGFCVVFVVLVLRLLPGARSGFGSCAPFCVFSAVIRLYKSLARKPWLNGLPRALHVQIAQSAGI